jgi:hypothetical protein
MEQKINIFIDKLANIEVPANAFNQYDFNSEFNNIRRHNLRCYLTKMVSFSPNILLVGEAPGL